MIKINHIVNKSKNPKTGEISITYRKTLDTCPTTCKFYIDAMKCIEKGITPSKGENPCYTLLPKPINWLQRKTVQYQHEFKKITGKVCRYLGSGDLFLYGTVDKAYINGIFEHQRQTPDLHSWLYTHGLKDIIKAGYKRSDVPDNLQFIASCDDENDVKYAKSKGFRVAEVSREFKITRKKQAKCRNDIDKNINCLQCGFCWAPKFKDLDILFKQKS